MTHDLRVNDVIVLGDGVPGEAALMCVESLDKRVDGTGSVLGIVRRLDDLNTLLPGRQVVFGADEPHCVVSRGMPVPELSRALEVEALRRSDAGNPLRVVRMDDEDGD